MTKTQPMDSERQAGRAAESIAAPEERGGDRNYQTAGRPTHVIEMWPIDRLVPYARNPRRNEAAVDRMCGSIREFGFKIPCLVRSDGEVVDGHLRLKAARKEGLAEIPVILCDEWTQAQVKAFRLMVNRSATWADWDEELLAQELEEIRAADLDLSLTGFDPGEIDRRLLLDDEERATGDENPLDGRANDISYRKEQLRRLQQSGGRRDSRKTADQRGIRRAA